MKLKILITLAALAGCAECAITNVKMLATSNTQALVGYTAPDAGACALEVSTSPSYTPPVHDVDTSLFSGSNLDSRSGNVNSGTERRFVIGTRAAQRGTDGHWYSRALQAVTSHYGRITCGADTATFVFVTANVALGNNWNDVYPVDPAARTLSYLPQAGAYAWPEFLSWTDRTEKVIDPQTGVQLQRLTLPQDSSNGNSPAGDNNFAAAAGTNWTNAGNVLADDASSATYANANRDFLFLQASIGERRNLLVDYNSPDYITLGFKAWFSSGSGTDLQVEGCETVNRVTCWPSNAAAKFQTITLSTSANPGTFTTMGTTVPVMDSWTPAGYQGLSRADIVVRNGYGTYTADVAVGGVATITPGTVPFSLAWTAGSHITIAGQDCTLSAAGASRETVTINTGSCSLSLPLTAATWSAANFGFLVRHKTTNTNQLNVQYAKFTYGMSHTAAMPSSGTVKLCGDTKQQNTVTSEWGYHCYVNDSGVTQMYWIGTTTGTVNFLGTPSAGFTGGGDGWDTSYMQGVLPVNLNSTTERYYFVTSDHNGKQVAVYCDISSTNQPGSLNNLGCTNLTVGSANHDLGTLATAFTASDAIIFDKTRFGVGFVGVVGTKLFLVAKRGGQDTYGWHLIFDPTMVSNNAGCVGGGAPGCIIAAQTSWAYPPARMCEIHTSFNTYTGNKVWISGKPFTGGFGAGPYQSTITSGALTHTPSIAAGTSGCPAGSQGCDSVTVNGNPCNTGDNTGESLNCPWDGTKSYLGAAAVGDVFTYDQEKVRIVTRTDATHWMLERGYGQNNDPADHGGATLSAYCQSPSGQWDFAGYKSGYDFGTSNWSWAWDFVADPHGTGSGVAIVDNLDHPAPRETNTVGYGGQSNQCLTNGLECYAVKDGAAMDAAPTKWVAAEGRFNGAVGPSGSETNQDHSGRNQTTDAPGSEQKWLMDARPLTPDGNRQTCGAATLVSGQLFKFTSTTSDGDNLTAVGGVSTLNRKRIPTIAYCGAHPLVDISSAATGNVIATDSSTPYTYCQSRTANECRTGSSAGDIYINCPAATKRGSDSTYGCQTVDSADEVSGSITVLNNTALMGAAIQVGYPANDYVGKYSRVITRALTGFGRDDVYWGFFSLPDARYAIVRSLWLNGVMPTILLAKLPPTPAIDSLDRTAYHPVKIQINPPTGLSIDNAAVKFGYAENGAAGSYFCMSRQEACYAKSATINQTTPFDWAGENTTGLSCASGCSIAVPAISGRTLYYQVVYRNAANSVVLTGPAQVYIVP